MGKKIIAENVEERDYDGRTALHRASQFTNDVELARALIEAGVDVNAQDDILTKTALHQAAAEGHVEFGTFLVENGARLDLKTIFNSTPLDYASHQNRFAAMLRT